MSRDGGSHKEKPGPQPRPEPDEDLKDPRRIKDDIPKEHTLDSTQVKRNE